MAMVQEVKEHLCNKIIPFWKRLRDDEHGGYYGYMDFDLKVDRQAVKGCILNSRITWFFANAYTLLKDESLLEEARHGYEFLRDCCMDKENGGIFWSMTYDGKPEDSTKHTYNQAFAIYALSSYYEASGDKEALAMAYDLFEGYTELYRVDHNPEVRARLEWIMDTFADHMYNPERHRQEVFFDREYHTLIDLHSYGHDIETAWLIDRGVEVLGDRHYEEKMTPITKDLTAQIYKTAFNGHSLHNECERGVVNTSRIWWVQAETVVGFLNGYQMDPSKKEYLEAARAEWTYIQEHLIDSRADSEWFWEVDIEGKPTSRKPIVEPWKCPYHNGRMCFEVIRRAEKLDVEL